jgi:TRAP-type C4-dicarboxylate transport system substrate-binding protein
MFIPSPFIAHRFPYASQDRQSYGWQLFASLPKRLPFAQVHTSLQSGYCDGQPSAPTAQGDTK